MEGLAYLTFDADVKEEFVEDEAALKALFQLSRVALRVPIVSLGQDLGWELTRLWQVSPASLVMPGRQSQLAALCGLGAYSVWKHSPGGVKSRA